MTDPKRPEHLAAGEEETQDDAIIGVAFRRSLLVIVAIVVIAAGAYLLTRAGDGPEAIVEKQGVGAIEDREEATAEMPAVSFADVTAEAGIDFVHVNGATGEKLLPETMGGGVAFFDHDGDGDQDLLFVNSAAWPWDAADDAATPRLYANDGVGAFTDVTREAGLDVSFYGMGVAVADYDNDGDADLFFTTLGANRLYRNDAGRFTEVTAQANVAGEQDRWSASAGFFDYDADGDLDLFVCNYVVWSKAIDEELNFSLNGRDRAYGPPTNYGGTYSYLYRNDGDGSFTDVSAAAGIQVDNTATGQPMGKALAVSFADVDVDGKLDILVANDTVQNFLFHNQGDGTFVEKGSLAGFGFDGTGNATGAMGLDAGYYRNDEQFGIAVANFANEMSSLYVSQREGLLQFTDESAGEGVGAPSRLVLSFGLFFFDYDLDGRLDILQANGHLEDEIEEVQASQRYRQPAQLFWNAGPEARSCFAEVPADRTGELSRPIVGRGAAYADIDGDGDLDVVLTQSGGAPLLLRNDQRSNHHWLRVELTGSSVNRDAIGSWVELEAGGVTQRRQVMAARSYLSQVERPLTFGLGPADSIDRLTVHWPDGTTRELDATAVDTTLKVEQR